jgi:3-oxoacyl-[acyl-carrier protein] reductase
MLAAELAPFNITVNNVLAGYIHTDQLSAYCESRAQETGGSAEEMMKEVAKAVPMGRLGKPEDVGDVIAFLASERAGYITGENVVLDGGAVKATL